MNVTTMSLVLCAGMLATPVFGRGAKGSTQGTVVKPGQAAPGQSARERLDKKYMVAFEPLGVATPLGLGSALRAGYYLSPNSVVELGFAFASVERDDDDDDFGSSDDYAYGYEREGESELLELRFKKFVTNSFYWSAGPADRRTKAELHAVDTYSTDKPSTRVASADVHDVGVSGTIGNQWQWESFTMGCDWVGLYMPLAKLKSKTDGEDGEARASDRKTAQKSFQDDATEMNAQGLRFYMGASF